mmetsp:Transcript_20700/g.62176  ORF Transcript_20700/g.62176 Transcript_20700/m.62176 type:complete len:234 (+) Transcript_20700:285-986(+)
MRLACATRRSAARCSAASRTFCCGRARAHLRPALPPHTTTYPQECPLRRLRRLCPSASPAERASLPTRFAGRRGEARTRRRPLPSPQVNPGEVKVLRGKGLPQHIYQEGSRQANPYDTGLRLKIERTVVNVSLDTPIDLDAQTSRQLVSPAGPRARGANTLAPAGTVVEGSVTPPSPFHHSPQLASNGDARFNYPPSMSLPSNCAPSGASMPPGVGAMLQPPQRPPARPTAFA